MIILDVKITDSSLTKKNYINTKNNSPINVCRVQSKGNCQDTQKNNNSQTRISHTDLKINLGIIFLIII